MPGNESGLGADGSVGRSGNHADAEAPADLVPLVVGGRAVDLAEVVVPNERALVGVVQVNVDG
jgi:hypothetical protein